MDIPTLSPNYRQKFLLLFAVEFEIEEPSIVTEETALLVPARSKMRESRPTAVPKGAVDQFCLGDVPWPSEIG